jgi:hypothetical protein
MSTTLRLPALALATALLGALALTAGCGGGNGDSATLTKAQFVAQGDAICAQARQAFLAAQPSPPSTPEKAAALQQELITTSEDELSRIRALSAPATVKPALSKYLSARENGIALLRKGLVAAQNKDLRGYTSAQSQVAAGQLKRLKLAQAVGFTACSRPLPQPSGGA